MNSYNPLLELAKLVETEETIVRIGEVYDEDLPRPVAYAIQLSSVCILLRAEPRDDTVIVEEVEKNVGRDSASLAKLQGARVRWAWLLTNTQGYEDGVAIRTMRVDGIARLVVFEVAGSMFTCECFA